MPKTDFTETLVDYIQGVKSREDLAIMGGRLVLGGSEGPDGGSGGSWTQPIGQLLQTQVTYDTTEAATDAINSVSSLLDNLNHIRYNINKCPIVYEFAIPSGAGSTVDLTMEDNIRIIDAWGILMTSGSGDIVKLGTTSNDITNEMSWSGAANSIIRAEEINLTHADLNSGETLRVTTSGSNIPAGKFYAKATKR